MQVVVILFLALSSIRCTPIGVKDPDKQDDTEVLEVEGGIHNHADSYRDGRHIETIKQYFGGLLNGDNILPTVAKCVFNGEGTGGVHSGPLGPPKTAHCGVLGQILITQGLAGENPNQAHFGGLIAGLTPGLHGFHVHAIGNLGDNCKAAGGHFNPEGVNHGHKDGVVRHVGDLGNLEVGQNGIAMVEIRDDHLALLRGANSIIGKSMVVHEGQDDVGLGGNEGSLKHGNAGARAGCCIIELVLG